MHYIMNDYDTISMNDQDTHPKVMAKTMGEEGHYPTQAIQVITSILRS